MASAFSHWKQTTWPVLAQLWPPATKFSVDQIPDLAGRIAIVTGVDDTVIASVASVPHLIVKVETAGVVTKPSRRVFSLLLAGVERLTVRP